MMNVLVRNRFFRQECLSYTWTLDAVYKHNVIWYMYHHKIPNHLRDMILQSTGSFLQLCKKGDLFMIKKIKDSIVKGSMNGIPISIRYGHLELLKYLLKKGCKTECPPVPLYYACKSGHLHIVEWLHNNGHSAKRTKWSVNEAASSGHLHIVQWLHEHGYRGSSWALNWASCYGHLHVIQYLLEYGYTIGDAVNWACYQGHFHMMKWYHDNNYIDSNSQEDYALDVASYSGNLHMVQFLHENGYSCTTYAMDWASIGGHLDVIKWLHNNRTEGCTGFALECASIGGHIDVVEWLCKNRKEITISSIMKALIELDRLRKSWISKEEVEEYEQREEIVKFLFKQQRIKDIETNT